MRTTIELPDDIFKQAKLRAVQEGTSLRSLIVRALSHELQTATAKPSAPSWSPPKARHGMGWKGFDDKQIKEIMRDEIDAVDAKSPR